MTDFITDTTKQLVDLVTGLASQQAMPDDAWQPRLSQLVVRIALLEDTKHYVERLALCSDHRDKTTGRCVICQAEERTRAEFALSVEARVAADRDAELDVELTALRGALDALRRGDTDRSRHHGLVHDQSWRDGFNDAIHDIKVLINDRVRTGVYS